LAPGSPAWTGDEQETVLAGCKRSVAAQEREVEPENGAVSASASNSPKLGSVIGRVLARRPRPPER